MTPPVSLICVSPRAYHPIDVHRSVPIGGDWFGRQRGGCVNLSCYLGGEPMASVVGSEGGSGSEGDVSSLVSQPRIDDDRGTRSAGRVTDGGGTVPDR